VIYTFLAFYEASLLILSMFQKLCLLKLPIGSAGIMPFTNDS